jgi:hypothetical protein
MRRCPIFEAVCGVALLAIDGPSAGSFTFQPSLAGGLFKPEGDDRFLRYRPEHVALYQALGVEVLGEAELFARFMLPALDGADAADRHEQIRYIRRHWSRTLSQNEAFVARLGQVAFVATADGRAARPSELFHPGRGIFRSIFQGEAVFPAGEFGEQAWLDILEQLGLQQELGAANFLQCARQIDRAASPANAAAAADPAALAEGAAELALHFVRNCNQLAADATFCRQLSDLRFLPMAPNPAGAADGLTDAGGLTEADEAGAGAAFTSYAEVAVPRDWALVWTKLSVCPEAFLPPQPLWPRLRIHTPPALETVVAHLSALPHDVLERWAFPTPRAEARPLCAWRPCGADLSSPSRGRPSSASSSTSGRGSRRCRRSCANWRWCPSATTSPSRAGSSSDFRTSSPPSSLRSSD